MTAEPEPAGTKNHPDHDSARTAARPEPVVAVRRPRKFLDLSGTQLIAGVGAAVTAAFLGSSLGVAGTLVGAGLASFVSVFGSAIYSRSIAVTGSGVRKVVSGVRGRPAVTERTSGRKTVSPAGPDLLLSSARRREVPAARPADRSDADRAPARWRTAGLLAAVAVVMFVTSLGVVTGWERVSGAAVSGGPGAFTVFGGGTDRTTTSTATVTVTTGAPTGTDPVDPPAAPDAEPDPSSPAVPTTPATTPSPDGSTTSAPPATTSPGDTAEQPAPPVTPTAPATTTPPPSTTGTTGTSSAPTSALTSSTSVPATSGSVPAGPASEPGPSGAAVQPE